MSTPAASTASAIDCSTPTVTVDPAVVEPHHEGRVAGPSRAPRLGAEPLDVQRARRPARAAPLDRFEQRLGPQQ